MIPFPPHVRRRAAILVGTALALRLLYLVVAGWNVEIMPGSDAVSYDAFARLMMSGFGWIDYPLAVREPLYPAFMMIAYLLPGPEILNLQVIQALLGAAASTVLYLGLRLHIRESIAFVSGWVVALNPRFIFFGILPYRENLLIPLVCLFLVLFFRASRSPEFRWHFWNAFVYVLLIHTDVRFLPLAAVLPLMFLLDRRNLRAATVATGWAVLIITVLMVPYQIRGFIAFGKPVIVTERVLEKWLPLAGTRIESSGEVEGADSRAAWLSEWEGMKESSLHELTAEERRYFLDGNRPSLGRLDGYLFNFLEYWRIARLKPAYRPYPDGRFERPWSRPHNASSTLVVVGFLSMLAVAMLGARPQERLFLLPVLAFLAAHCLLHVVVHSIERYRVPLEVFFAVVIACGLIVLWRRSYSFRSRTEGPAV